MAAPFQQTRTVYQDYQAKLSPTALLRPNGAAFEAALGAMKDAQLERDIAAVKARYPDHRAVRRAQHHRRRSWHARAASPRRRRVRYAARRRVEHLAVGRDRVRPPAGVPRDRLHERRHRAVFPSPLPASWVSGGVPSSSSNEANFIRALIAAWKPGHATCNRIVIITAGGVWGYSDGTWGDGGTWGSSTTTVWTP
jgi:hypothetical protein